MAEKRKFESMICVKIGAKISFKIELFPAEQWAESAQGRYRLRVNRRWHNGPDGAPVYLDMVQIAALVGALAQGGDLTLDPVPDIPRGSSVSVPNGRTWGGVVWRDVTRTVTPVIRAHDGRWYVGVIMIDQGTIFIPVADLIILPPKAGGKKRVKGV